MLELNDDWIWDSWYVWEGAVLHAFYLKAPKSLEDSNLRHHNARVGHSTSRDGFTWQHHLDALSASERASFDDQAIWTGSIVQHFGKWHLFYTGIDRISKGKVQRIGHAVSEDLFSWNRVADQPVLTASPEHYSVREFDPLGEEPFRDPWVFFFEGTWQMLVTARDTVGGGNMAHATSVDLITWTLQPPLIRDSKFDQLEVFQLVQISGKWFLMFCARASDVHRPGVQATNATYAAPAAGPLGPFDLDRAHPVPAQGGIYAGRVVQFPDGSSKLLGFLDDGSTDGFSGIISDPLTLCVDSRGDLVLNVQ